MSESTSGDHIIRKAPHPWQIPPRMTRQTPAFLESTFGPAAPPRFGALRLRSVATGNSAPPLTKE